MSDTPLTFLRKAPRLWRLVMLAVWVIEAVALPFVFAALAVLAIKITERLYRLAQWFRGGNLNA